MSDAKPKLYERLVVPHCWEDGPETDDGCSTSCMLMYGHEGPHEWVRDDHITITFRKDEAAGEGP